MERGLLIQHFPADRNDMKAVLCRVRETRWNEALKRAAQPDAGRSYQGFMKDDLPDDQWSTVINTFLSGLSLWRDMTADEIIEEIRNSPADCRKAFDRLLGRYWSAAHTYISDILPSDEWRTYWFERFQESRELFAEEVPVFNGKIEDEAFSFCRFLDEDADVNIRVLMERMFMIQQIQERLSEPVGYGDSSAGNQIHSSKKPRGAKKVVIEFIKEQVIQNPEFERLAEMKQGRSFKTEKAALWEAFRKAYPEHDGIKETFKNDYVTDAIKELRKQTSD